MKQKVNVVKQDDYAFIVNDDVVLEKITFLVGGVELKMLIDSGATSNIMGANVWQKLKDEKIKCHVLKEYSDVKSRLVTGLTKLSSL